MRILLPQQTNKNILNEVRVGNNYILMQSPNHRPYIGSGIQGSTPSMIDDGDSLILFCNHWDTTLAASLTRVKKKDPTEYELVRFLFPAAASPSSIDQVPVKLFEDPQDPSVLWTLFAQGLVKHNRSDLSVIASYDTTGIISSGSPITDMIISRTADEIFLLHSINPSVIYKVQRSNPLNVLGTFNFPNPGGGNIVFRLTETENGEMVAIGSGSPSGIYKIDSALNGFDSGIPPMNQIYAANTSGPMFQNSALNSYQRPLFYYNGYLYFWNPSDNQLIQMRYADFQFDLNLPLFPAGFYGFKEKDGKIYALPNQTSTQQYIIRLNPTPPSTPPGVFYPSTVEALQAAPFAINTPAGLWLKNGLDTVIGDEYFYFVATGTNLNNMTTAIIKTERFI